MRGKMSRNIYEKRRHGFDDDDWNYDEESEYKKESIRQKRKEKSRKRAEFFDEVDDMRYS